MDAIPSNSRSGRRGNSSWIHDSIVCAPLVIGEATPGCVAEEEQTDRDARKSRPDGEQGPTALVSLSVSAIMDNDSMMGCDWRNTGWIRTIRSMD